MDKVAHSSRTDRSGRTATPSRPADPEQIARLAYSYWEARGGQAGSAEEDWYRAEQELARRQTEAEERLSSQPVTRPGRPLSRQANQSN